MTEPPKARVATASLAGCFGCHMAILDIDERLIDLMALVEIDRSPLTDKETLHAALRHRDHRRRLLQRGKRPRSAGVPAQLRRADRAWAMRDHGRAAGDAQRHHAFRRAAARVPGGGLYHRSGHPEHDPQHPQRSRAAALLDKVYPCSDVVRNRLQDPRLRTHGRRVIFDDAEPACSTANSAASSAKHPVRLGGRRRWPNPD
jgi:hypothetical protein